MSVETENFHDRGNVLEPIIIGCALPYNVDRTEPGQPAGTVQRFAPNCCADAIRRHQIELNIDHNFDEEFLVDQRHGRLHVWENVAGLYFLARLPATAHSQTVIDRMLMPDRRPSFHPKTNEPFGLRVCCGAGRVQSRRDAQGRDLVWSYELLQFSLLLTSEGCFPTSWALPVNYDSRWRLQRELAAAETVAQAS